ncbi:MAG: hypothetical protein JSR09_04070 [Bacteroidetes bacterium]|nr:hypothetical protein [Bacteroidota bacterium]MBS1648862.1 hypothetical protein [Bacteroidota bacterium]
MPQANQELILLIIAVSLILMTLGTVFLIAMLYYRKRKKNMEEEHDKIKKKFQQQLLQSQLEIQEQTFNAISQEIHDNVGQILSLAKVQMNIAEEQQKSSSTLLKDAKENITRALDDLRDIAKSLSTDRVEKLDFLQILKNEVERLNRIKKIKCNLTIAGASREIGNKHKLISFRIIQESINNILKHARASEINIAISFTEKELNTIVTDNGIGFNTTLSNKGLGLQNIIKRAELIGGNASIKSEINKGTSVTINIPYEQ